MPALIVAAGAFVAGTVLAALLGGAWWASALLAVALAAAAWLALPRGRFDRPSALVLIAAVALLAAGHARFAAADGEALPPLASLSGTHKIVAVAQRDATVRATFARVDLTVQSIDGVAATGGLRLSLPAPERPILGGDRIRAVVAIEPPPVLADFDYAGYLRDRGIHAMAAFPSEFAVIERESGNVAIRELRRVRRWLVANIERSLPEPEAALAAGILIGERPSFASGLSDDLRRTGTTHLVVVSGQNVALLLGITTATLTMVLSRRRASLLVLALLPAYVLLVGLDPPVLRAAIMAVGIAVAGISGRRTPGWIYLLYAAALMLAVDPLLARDVAFQLSMSATAGVMLIAPPLRDRILTLAGWQAEGARAAVVEAGALAGGAALAVLPVQAAAFENISLLTVPANVIVAPLYEATVAVAALTALLGFIDPFADAFGATARFVPAAFVATVDVLARLPGGELTVRAPLAAGAGWYAALIAGVWALQRGEAPVLAPSARSGFATTTALAAISGGLWLAVLAPAQPYAAVTVLDAGRGLAVLIEDGDSRVLVDTGPPDGAIVEALSRAGVRGRIEAVVITHDHLDHRGGLRELQLRFDIDRVLGGADATQAPPVEVVDIGDRIRLSARTTIEVLSPPIATAGRRHRSENDRSLVLLVTIGERRILLTADIEAPAEQWLLASGTDLRADVLVVAHHGSNSSSTRDFLDAVQPSVAVIPAGFPDPHPAVLARLGGGGVLIFRTDLDGDVTLLSDGKRLWAGSSR